MILMKSRLETLEIKGDYVVVSVNTAVYPVDIIYNAAYAFLDRCYILLDGDDEIVKISLKPKRDIELEIVGREFCNELINYAAYKAASARNSFVRETVLKRLLLTNEEEVNKDYLNDPDNIMVVHKK